MKDMQHLEEYYKKFTKDINKHIPEGITIVDLELLHKYHLLNQHSSPSDSNLTRYFHVVEADDKITLINDQFVIWIIPDVLNNEPITYILISLNFYDTIRLETAFATTGIYNSSKLVLRILEKMLLEIQETEDLLSNLRRKATS